MKDRVIAGAIVAAALLAVAAVVLNPFGDRRSISERLSAQVDAEATCERYGFQEVAGEREKAYNCSYTATIETHYGSSKGKAWVDHVYVENCASLVDGLVYSRLGNC